MENLKRKIEAATADYNKDTIIQLRAKLQVRPILSLLLACVCLFVFYPILLTCYIFFQKLKQWHQAKFEEEIATLEAQQNSLTTKMRAAAKIHKFQECIQYKAELNVCSANVKRAH